MLDVIRSHAQSWGVKVAFGLIIVVFVFWGVGTMHEGPTSVVATVNKKPIVIRDFSREYERQVEALRTRFPGVTADELKKLGLKRQVLQQMVAEMLLQQEAERLGVTVTPIELRSAIEQIPVFRDAEGRFDPETYKKVLKAQQTTPGRFEDGVRRDMLGRKMRALVTAGAVVTDAEARDMFTFAQEKRSIDYVLFPIDEYAAAAKVDDAKLHEWYEAHKTQFTVPQKVRLDFVRISPEALAANVEIPETAIAAFYGENAASYFMQPERVRARHILVRVPAEASDDMVQKAKARIEEAAAQIKGGKDFAAVAAKFSEDGSASNGGELGWFGRGEMVKPFEDAAFGLKPGEVSAPVRSQFGFHLVKSEGHEAQRQKSLDEVRPEIRKRLAEEKAIEKVHDSLDGALELVSAGKSLDDIAAQLKLERQTSEPLTREAAATTLGLKPGDVTLAFSAPAGTVIDTPLEAAGGYIIARVAEVAPEHVPAFDTVRDKVLTAVREEEGARLALSAAEDAFKASREGELPAATLARVKTSPLFGRDGNIPGLGLDPALAAAAFSAEKGVWSDKPHSTPQGVVLLRVREITKPTDAQWQAVSSTVRETILAAKREEMFRTFLTTLNAKGKVEVKDVAQFE